MRRTTPQTIRLLELHDEIRLIFTDMNIPGRWTGSRSRIMFADGGPREIIVTSGYMKVPGHDLPVGALFVGKPYHPEHITHKMKELMAA